MCTLQNLLKNSQAVKKGEALCKMASMKKLWNRWWPRMALMVRRSMTKILIMVIQVNLCCLIPASLGIGLSLLKFLSLNYCLNHFLAANCIFILAILHRAAHFFTAWQFLSRYHKLIVFLCCRKKKSSRLFRLYPLEILVLLYWITRIAII